jgi:SAM-dependent methyltransferase
VNARHRDVHYRGIAEDLRRYVPAPDAVVMDYGCGDALHAGIVAAAAGRLILVEAPPGVVAGLTARFAAGANIAVVTPDRLAQYPDHGVDLIVLHSVAQYLSAEALDALLARFHRLLRHKGLLIVGDVIPPDLSTLADVTSLLRLALAHGFLGAALLGLVKTLTSDYARLRGTLGLARYDAPAMLAKLKAAGFSAERAPRNIGHNQGRMTFLARPA